LSLPLITSIGGIMTTKCVPTIAVFPEERLTLTEKIEKWTYLLTQSLHDNYKLRYPDSSSDIDFIMESGRKYWKIVQHSLDRNGERWSGGVHAFVDRNTGEVYKPASYKSPAKIVRFDLRLIEDRVKLHNPNFTDWAGGYLYLR